MSDQVSATPGVSADRGFVDAGEGTPRNKNRPGKRGGRFRRKDKPQHLNYMGKSNQAKKGGSFLSVCLVPARGESLGSGPKGKSKEGKKS